jgi:hypothetical protein
LIIIAVYVCSASLLSGQNPPIRAKTTAAVDEARRAATESIGSKLPLPLTVPSLFGMNRVEASRTLEALRLRPAFSRVENGIVVDQKPAAGTTVRFGSEVAVALGVMPRLVLNGPVAPAYAGSELTFTASLVPPLPAGPQVTYRFLWGDGSRADATANAVVTHRFADATRHMVSVVAVIDGRVTLEGRVPVDVVALPPLADTASTATVVATSDTTATVATEDPAAPATTGTTASTTSSAPATTATTAPETTTETPITATTATSSVAKPDTSSNLLLMIAAAAVVLLLVVTFLLVRVLRALNRKPPEPQLQAKSPVAFTGGMRAIEYQIVHPELIRRGPSVGLRGGIRAEEGGDV